MSVCNHGESQNCYECRYENGRPNRTLKDYSLQEIKDELKRRKTDAKRLAAQTRREKAKREQAEWNLYLKLKKKYFK